VEEKMEERAFGRHVVVGKGDRWIVKDTVILIIMEKHAGNNKG